LFVSYYRVRIAPDKVRIEINDVSTLTLIEQSRRRHLFIVRAHVIRHVVGNLYCIPSLYLRLRTAQRCSANVKDLLRHDTMTSPEAGARTYTRLYINARVHIVTAIAFHYEDQQTEAARAKSGKHFMQLAIRSSLAALKSVIG
jgi:hypothetical protein